jgi:hypothetical protein
MRLSRDLGEFRELIGDRVKDLLAQCKRPFFLPFLSIHKMRVFAAICLLIQAYVSCHCHEQRPTKNGIPYFGLRLCSS